MKTASLVVILLLATFGCAREHTLSRQSSDALAALSSQERAWTEAFKNRNRDTLNKLIADEFIFTDEEGHIYDKQQYVAAAIDAIRVDSYTVDETKITSFGNTGVVTGRWTGKLSIDGKDASGAFRFTDTFVRRNGQWQVVASQDTRIASPKSQ